ncbi:MAG: hypothetical protein ACO1OD_02620 [Croceibacterium sp.]
MTEAALRLREDLARRTGRLAEATAGDFRLTVEQGQSAVWLRVRRDGQQGGFALSLCPFGPDATLRRKRRGKDLLRFEVDAVIGTWRVLLTIDKGAVPLIRAGLSLTPSRPLVLPWLGRDLFMIGEDGDPASAQGRVEAAQRGVNGGAMYLRLTEPDFGSLLYFQDLTALNPYFNATGTKPDGVVGGDWPELGYLPPAPAMKGQPDVAPLPAGVEVLVSRPLIALHGDSQGAEEDQARRFLQLLGEIYPHLERPEPEFRDWRERARKSWQDLDKSPYATISHYGARYVRPYTDAEYPDSMVQLTLLASMCDWRAWSGEEPAPYSEMRKGVAKFHDTGLRRYLPNVGDDKDADAVDSWYMYHPLLNLARLAQDGDAGARQILFDALERGIEAAHHFSYKWPIQYKIDDFSVITESRDDDGHGQTDVGGIYAYLMLQAFSLSEDQRYLDEARAALDAARGAKFELNYQANLTAWGAAACLRMWRITGSEDYLRQSYIFLASFFHNTALWESDIAHARHYRNFLGATALHDAPYMAMYECFESFAAFEVCLKDSGPQIEPAVQLLLAEYCKYALDRAWFYYPDALPPEVLADEQRNGHIACDLSFPLEDLYVDGQPAGQVGQEIYGGGAAAVFATRSFHRFEGAPFELFCDSFLLAIDRPSDRAIIVKLAGAPQCEALLALCALQGKRLPDVRVEVSGKVQRARRRPRRREYRVPAGETIELTW